MTTATRDSSAEVLIYALGGGRGHATRGAALGAALTAAGVRARVLVQQQRVELARALGAEAIGVARPADPQELRACVEALLARLGARCLIVDCFPAGLLGELRAALPVQQVLLARCHLGAGSRPYLRALHNYALVVDLEPHLDWLALAEGSALRFGPIIRPLQLEPPSHDVLLVADDVQMRSFFTRLAARLGARGLRVLAVADGERFAEHGVERGALSLAPLAASLLGSTVIVGAAGFNLSYEACFCYAHHLALPRTRAYDDQRRRAQAMAELCASPEALEGRAETLARAGRRREPTLAVRPAEALAHELIDALGLSVRP